MRIDKLEAATSSRLAVIGVDDTVRTAARSLSRPEIGLLIVCRENGEASGVLSKSERGDATFGAVHLDGARRVAEAATREGARLLHLSGIGSDADAASPYVRARGRGENAVRAACNGATVFRPCVMIGAGDAFLSTLTGLVRRLPVLPLFGDGGTRLQPVFVGDVAEAAATALAGPDPRPGIFELGGPEVRTYRALVELVMRHCRRRRALLPVPFPVWDGLAVASSVLPAPPLTEGQVALMKRDNVANPDLPGLAALGVVPTTVEDVLRRDFPRS